MRALRALAPRFLLRFFVLAVVAGGCGGGGCDGCGGMAPTPGGFPAEDRTANAIQLRITSSAIATLEADPASLVAPLLGQGGLAFDIPASCGGDTEICCVGGVPSDTCGPLEIDLEEQAGDEQRLEIVPVAGERHVDITIRARLISSNPIPVRAQGFSCDVSIDTSAGARDGITLTIPLSLPQDADELTTRLEVGETTIDLENDDVSIGGGIFCTGISLLLKDTLVGLLTDSFSDMIGEGLTGETCLACESGTTMECGGFADSCTGNVCMIGDRCEQHLGIAGRMTAAGLFGGFSSGQLGKLDVYDVAGGYTETDNDGLSIGMYSGALPFAEPRDRCGPLAEAPEQVAIPESPFFAGNTRPDTNAPFQVGIGVHQQVLDHLAYAAYESGGLCLNIAPGAVDLLTTDGLGPLLMPSVVDLLHGKNSPIVMGLRPQSPPTIKIGPGTTMEGAGGETIIVEPLLDVRFDALEIDFFVVVDDQFIRVMTLAADVRLPVNLEVNEVGEIQPVLGDVDNAFSNIAVTNSEALRESDEELEEKIPVLLSLALPSLLDGLGSFALPSLGGIDIQIAEDGILSVEDNAFLALYADLALETQMARVQTEARVLVAYEDEEPVVTLRMGGDAAGLEYSFQIDGGLWAPFTSASEVSLRRDLFYIAGIHTIAVRARLQGRPLSADLSPVVLSAVIPGKPGVSYFHGIASEEGCACNGGGSSGGWLAALVLLVLMGRPRRYAGHLALVGLAVLSGCSCGSDPGGVDCLDECLEGEVVYGPIGRYSSFATGDGRKVIAAYDETLGDLVLAEANEDNVLSYRAIAGVPDVLPTYEPDTYRNGIAAPGPDQGLWTSIAIYQGKVLVAFVDGDDGSVLLAREQEDGTYITEVVDTDTGRSGASYLSLSVSATGVPTIAYLAHGVSTLEHDGLLSELRVADGGANWTTEVVDVGPIRCGGLCDDLEECVDTGTIEECKEPTGTCDGGCGSNEACVDGVCLAIRAAPLSGEMLDGVGLFPELLRLADGSMVLGYYDRVLGHLQIATSTGSGFTAVDSLEDPSLDTGMWLSMVADGDTAHLAFQDASGDRLMYATFSEGTLSVPVFVDDGVRAGDNRAHPVGASASIQLDGDRSPVIVYQDGLTADVEIATNELGSWVREPLLEGPRLDGFFIDSAVAEGTILVAHLYYDRADTPMGTLEIVTLEN